MPQTQKNTNSFWREISMSSRCKLGVHFLMSYVFLKRIKYGWLSRIKKNTSPKTSLEIVANDGARNENQLL